MIGMAILAILITMAIPAAGDWLRNSQIRTAAESVQDGLQQARNEAVKRNAAVEFRLVGGSAWEIWLADTTLPATDRKLFAKPSGEGAKDVVLTAIPGGAATVTFDGMGRRYPVSKKNADGTDVLTGMCVDLPPSVMAAAKTHDLELDVNLGGTVRMCDPKVSAATDNRVCSPYPTPCTSL
jgi:type IV fimbrial biogenesis protein FimT